MMKRILLLLCFFGVVLTTQAQTTNTPNAADKEYREAVGKLLDASGTTMTMRAQFPVIMEMIKKIQPNVPDDVFQELENRLSSVFMNQYTDLCTPVYKRYFSLEELRAYTAFFETPVGKKVGQIMPILNKDLMDVGQQVGQSIGQQVIEELKKKGYTPKNM